MKMIKHASLFKWPQNGASKMTNITNDVVLGNNHKTTSQSKVQPQSSNNQQQQQQPNQASCLNSLSSSTSTTTASNQQQSHQKLWLHPPATLQNGHIAYLVKYFGNVEVNQPKGIDVVKESINKLKFIQPIKKSEGQKIPKVELTISVNGVAIQEPKSKKIYCQFPLHRISYCADDKTEKKFFSFIAKDVDTDKHLCFVFMSEKMSEEIILTIGQAFDLAYAKFIETSGRELEIRKQLIILQKKVCHLEEENKKLKERLGKYEPITDLEDNDGVDDDFDKSANSVENRDSNNDHDKNGDPNSKPVTSSKSGKMVLENGFGDSSSSAKNANNGHVLSGKPIIINNNKNGVGTKSAATSLIAAAAANLVPVPPLQPPPSSSKTRSNQQINLIDVDIECNDNTATLLNNNNNNDKLMINNNAKLISDLFDEDFNPRAQDTIVANNDHHQSIPPILNTIMMTNNNNVGKHDLIATNTKTINNGGNSNQKNAHVSPIDDDFGSSITQEKDIFGCEPFQVQQDPFGMTQFNGTDLDKAITNIDKKLAEMRDGFSQGLSADGFNLDS